MPRLHPLRAVRYAADADITTKIAPPYDVLDEGPKRALLERDPANIVAIDLPVTPPKTVGPDAAYEKAGATYRDWLDRTVLKQDATPALFAYEQAYTVGDRSFKRRGLIGTLDAEEFNQPNGIFRHEQTIRSGTDDRFKLMTASKAQLSPVFGVFSDPQSTVRALLEPYFAGEPDFHGTTGHDGVEHRCWTIDSPETIAALVDAFAPKEVFIADGHHRYTTALNYSKEHGGTDASGRCLFVLVPIEDPGMIVQPYHRVVTGMSGFDMDTLVEAVEADARFNITTTAHGPDELDALQQSLAEAGHHAIGLYDPAGKRIYIVTTVEADPLADELADRAPAFRKLDVAMLHLGLIDGIIRPRFGGDAVAYEYTADLGDLVTRAHHDGERLGVIMQATPLESVCDVSRANDVMPPKSTFFYPKLATGLVIHDLSQEVPPHWHDATRCV